MAARLLCLVLGHRWRDSPDDYDAEYSAYPILHCERCGKQKAFPPWKALDPVWRLGRVGRARFLATEAAHWVGAAVLIGLVIPGIVALLEHAAGKHNTQEVKPVLIALLVEGGLAMLVATIVDPMGYGSARDTYLRGGLSVLADSDDALEGYVSSPTVPGQYVAGSARAAHGLRNVPVGRLMRIDDLLYAGGAILIAIAVLLYKVAM